MGSVRDDSTAREDVESLCQTIRTSLLGWPGFALAPLGHQPSKHQLLLIAKLESVAFGRVDRLMLLLPPDSAKSGAA